MIVGMTASRVGANFAVASRRATPVLAVVGCVALTAVVPGRERVGCEHGAGCCSAHCAADQAFAARLLH